MAIISHIFIQWTRFQNDGIRGMYVACMNLSIPQYKHLSEGNFREHVLTQNLMKIMIIEMLWFPLFFKETALRHQKSSKIQTRHLHEKLFWFWFHHRFFFSSRMSIYCLKKYEFTRFTSTVVWQQNQKKDDW